MTLAPASFLLIGESDVGKTHYGAQLLRRLNSDSGSMCLENSNNLTPFSDTMDKISEGLSGLHTPRSESTESQWIVSRKSDGVTFELNWPDYGGEQISSMINERRMPAIWRDKRLTASAWAFMIRPSRVRLPEDVMTRHVRLPPSIESQESQLSSQLRLIEILQMLRFKRSAYTEDWSTCQPLCIILSCYDELNTEMKPQEYCETYLPLLASFLKMNWPKERLKYFGASPLGQSLSESKPDKKFMKAGPANMGYVIGEDGVKDQDLLAPINWMLNTSAIT